MVPHTPIPFVDLASQRGRLGNAVEQAIARVLDHGQFILGPEVALLEQELARFTGASHVVTCASGTSALELVLLAYGIGEGDAVICPAYTFAATAEIVALRGAIPVFADIEARSFNLDSASVGSAVATARTQGFCPKAVIAVDLFGQPANYDDLEKLCQREGLILIADAAQSLGATYRERRVGTLGTVTCTSFFPSKPLGCYGDGGAIFTGDDELASVLRSLRMHGQGRDKDEFVRIGLNGRMDSLQAAILLEKLSIFSDEIDERNLAARRYSDSLSDVAICPNLREGVTSVWAQYTLCVAAALRDPLRKHLAENGVPTAVYYPTPLHRQAAYQSYPVVAGGLPVSDTVRHQALSLPIHAYLNPQTQQRIIELIREFLHANA